MKQKAKRVKVRFLRENYEATYGQGSRFTHMGDDRRMDDEASINDHQPIDAVNEETIPGPRARVGDVEEYNRVYAMLMGRPQMATNSPLKDMMAELEAGDPLSCAQAVADYLHDRAKIK